MTAKLSAGCLVRALFDGEVRYLVVHPSGGDNRGAAYFIPEGPALLTAKRFLSNAHVRPCPVLYTGQTIYYERSQLLTRHASACRGPPRLKKRAATTTWVAAKAGHDEWMDEDFRPLA